jgi:hypothetical protein
MYPIMYACIYMHMFTVIRKMNDNDHTGMGEIMNILLYKAFVLLTKQYTVI